MKRSAIIVFAAITLLSGCGRVKDQAKRATNKAGQAVGEGASTFFTGVGEGIDKTVTTYDIRLSEELRNAGVSTTIAKRIDATSENQNQPSLSIYIQSKAPLSGMLRIRFFNEQQQEIGRSSASVAFSIDDAKYVSFPLDKQLPLAMTKHLEMDLKKE